MNPFDLNAWEYHLPMQHVIEQLPEAFRARRDPGQLFTTLRRGGGKSLGLTLCAEIARHCPNLSVPLWGYLTRAEQQRILFFGDHPDILSCFADDRMIMMRSSDLQEDWISSDAGTFLSVKRRRDDLYDILPQFYGKQLPVVIQEHVEGVGIVVDIGHSLLLDRLVMRIACGRRFRKHESAPIQFSSATYDKDGRFLTFDPMTGERILPDQEGHVLLPTLENVDFSRLARELFQSVSAAGITFGCQLELIIHPDHPDTWHLVQVRPSPQMLRTLIQTIKPPESGRLVATSPVVNMSYRFKAPIVVLSSREDPLWKWTFKVGFNGSSECFFLDETERRRPKNHIVVWKTNPQENLGLLQVEQFTALGALGHVSVMRLLVNTVHTAAKNAEKVLFEQSRFSRLIGTLSLDQQALYELDDLLVEGAQICMISDGLIGQLFIEH